MIKRPLSASICITVTNKIILQHLLHMKIMNTSFGIKAAIELTAKDDIAPKPTSVFMLGEPINKLLKPSRTSLRPGPRNVNNESDK